MSVTETSQGKFLSYETFDLFSEQAKKVVVKVSSVSKAVRRVVQRPADDQADPQIDLFLNRIMDAIGAPDTQKHVAEDLAAKLDEDFSDEEIVWLHWRILEDGLEILGRKGCATEKREFLQWVFAPQSFLTHGGKKWAEDMPFSCAKTCRLFGYDIERLQSALLCEPSVREIMRAN